MEGGDRFEFLVQKSVCFDLSLEEYEELTELLNIEHNFLIYYPQAMAVMTEMMSESAFKTYASAKKPSIKYHPSPDLKLVPVSKLADSGHFYFGQINKKTRQFEGIGIEVNSEGQVFHSAFYNGSPNGKGILINNSDLLYFNGEYVNGKFYGTGTYINHSGNIFEGQWKADKINGFVIQTDPNGDIYEGNYVDGKPEGLEKFTQNDGVSTEGQWENNQLNGYAINVLLNGVEYFGNYKNGFKDGNGNLTSPDGSSISGKWVHDKCEKGVYLDTKGREYKIPDEISYKKALSMLESIQHRDNSI
ncbi:unnamed protein product [Moneuplotes crassus]|uniref:MORN repeat protein n=1 Tax=Euplotes crassus TaxID=5936 RepID=A0AAD1XS05_EUPCR|nr:unnamed protein product [Moneuplotes crassus]